MIYFLMKEGYYYRHASRGYTSSPMEAELYDEIYAKNHSEMIEGCIAIPLTEVVKDVDYIDDCIDRLEAMKNELTLIDKKEGES